jgi:NitT/TauT family transport system ATP-binding protein
MTSRQVAGPPPSASSSKIELRHVSRYFKAGSVQALADVDFSVRDGEFVSLLGPSGCGKTTLLRLVDGLIGADEGEVLVDGRPPVPGPEIGFVFQQARLLPWRTVQGNVEFAMQASGMPPDERAVRASALLATVGLQDFAGAHPHELSGGMQQRVALARAFALEPTVLLMDEPFAALDAMTRQFMRHELQRVWSARRSAVLFVTHDIDEAIFLSQRIVLLQPRPGRVDEIFTVDLPDRRWDADLRHAPEFSRLHHELWERIRDMVGSASDWAGHQQPGAAR